MIMNFDIFQYYYLDMLWNRLMNMFIMLVYAIN